MKIKIVLFFIVFLILNFGALAVGGYFTGIGVPSDWYHGLNKAPWTPPGWVFGASWTTIMICFSIYMALLWNKEKNKSRLVLIYLMQLILNIGWNPVFFYFHEAMIGLMIIILLTLLVIYFLFKHRTQMKGSSILILPYAIWLFIATSLNAYVVLYN